MYLDRFCPSFAANSKRQNPWENPTGRLKHLFIRKGYTDSDLAFLCWNDSFWKWPFHRKVTIESHWFPIEQRGGNGLCCTGAHDQEPLARRPCIHRKHTVPIGCRGDNRLCSNRTGDPPGERIGSPHMPGYKRYGKPSAVVHSHYRRIGKFAP